MFTLVFRFKVAVQWLQAVLSLYFRLHLLAEIIYNLTLKCNLWFPPYIH